MRVSLSSILLIVRLLSCCCAQQGLLVHANEKSENILIIGNSIADRHGLSYTLGDMMKEFASPGRSIACTAHIQPMSQFASHVKDATRMGGQSPLRTLLAATNADPGTAPHSPHDWKWIIYQEQSVLAGLAEDNLQLFETSARSAARLNELTEAVGAGTIWMMTWGRQFGHVEPPFLRKAFPDFNKMTSKVDEGYRRYMSITSRSDRPTYVAPCGLAFQRMYKPVVDDLNTEGSDFWNLFEYDGIHSSPSGTYLCACVLFATMTGLDPRLSTVVPYGTIEVNMLHRIQQAAYDTMVDYYDWYEPGTDTSAIDEARNALSQKERDEANNAAAEEKANMTDNVVQEITDGADVVAEDHQEEEDGVRIQQEMEQRPVQEKQLAPPAEAHQLEKKQTTENVTNYATPATSESVAHEDGQPPPDTNGTEEVSTTLKELELIREGSTTVATEEQKTLPSESAEQVPGADKPSLEAENIENTGEQEEDIVLEEHAHSVVEQKSAKADQEESALLEDASTAVTVATTEVGDGQDNVLVLDESPTTGTADHEMPHDTIAEDGASPILDKPPAVAQDEERTAGAPRTI